LFLGWSLGFSLFLELLSALAMLQGSHFLLLIHLSLAKSVLLELFYHIEGVQKMQGKARNDAPSVVARLALVSRSNPCGDMRLPRFARNDKKVKGSQWQKSKVLVMTGSEGLAMTKRGDGDKPRPCKSM